MSKNCPSCGRPIEFDEKYSKVISCPYCNTILEFGSSELTKIGEQGEFIEFPSIFKVGKVIDWESRKVYVKGQIRYEYDGGFFDEFSVVIDGKEYVLKEDDGLVKIMKDGSWKNIDISLIDKPVGQEVSIGGENVFVQEIGTFKLVNIKGEINNYLTPGESYEYLDGIINGNLYSIEKEIGKKRIKIMKEIKL